MQQKTEPTPPQDRGARLAIVQAYVNGPLDTLTRRACRGYMAGLDDEAVRRELHLPMASLQAIKHTISRGLVAAGIRIRK